jgi:hypothetical protein
MGGFKLILTFSSQIESADGERRVIAGKIVPFESVGNTSVGKVVFAKGSIDVGDPGKHIDFTINDVTEYFYDIVTKGDTVKKVFKKDIVVGQKVLEVNLKFGEQERKLPLRLGLDILERNGLKQLETSDPVLHVITWRESSVSLRYASVVLCNEGHAIWSNFYADRIMLPKPE